MVTVPGRGAWSKRGGTTPYYEYLIDGSPLIGSQKDLDDYHRAVHYGVLAIQRAYNKTLKIDTPITGIFDAATRDYVKVFQAVATQGTAVVDGKVGSKTASWLFRTYIKDASRGHNIPANILVGLCGLESGFDPGAVGANGYDTGLWQINRQVHSSISEDFAFGPKRATGWACKYLKSFEDKYRADGKPFSWDHVIASYNSPAAGLAWHNSGNPPNETIEKYVNLVWQLSEFYSYLGL